jgi:hypothetical protein
MFGLTGFTLLIFINFGCAERQADKNATPQMPDIIFILADSLGYDDLDSFGQENIQAPNLDRLAGKGTHFTNQNGGSTVRTPSRAVLMTGPHAGHAPLHNSMKNPGWSISAAVWNRNVSEDITRRRLYHQSNWA